MLKQAWQRWLDRRLPRARQVQLDQRRIFIFPTGYGFLYLLVSVLLFFGVGWVWPLFESAAHGLIDVSAYVASVDAVSE